MLQIRFKMVTKTTQMAEAGQPELECQSLASSVSVNLHEDIAEVIPTSQVNSSNEVDVFHVSVDKHIDEHAHAPKLVAATSATSLTSVICKLLVT
jgi:hypothetical protein